MRELIAEGRINLDGVIDSRFRKNDLPEQIMFNFHPQRWHDDHFKWSREIVVQNAKNVVKRFFFVVKN